MARNEQAPDQDSMKHKSMISASTEGATTTITLRCETCKGVTVTLPTVHFVELANVLPRICEQFGLDPDVASVADVFTTNNKPPPLDEP